MPITDWDDAYANSAYVPGVEKIFASWPVQSAAFEAAHASEDLTYGAHERHRMRLFRPDGTCRGLVLFVHGGYWVEGDGALYSHLAGGSLARGYAVAIPSYRLAPEATIADITDDIRAAIGAAAAIVDGPIYLAGHSAGGHLVSRMGCADGLPDALAKRVAHILSISGVHDLRPLLRTEKVEALHLTVANAQTDSPALLEPRPGLRLTAVVGAKERPEFLRQTDLLANVWWGLGADTMAVHLAGQDHFSILDGLCAADGALTTLLLDQSS